MQKKEEQAMRKSIRAFSLLIALSLVIVMPAGCGGAVGDDSGTVTPKNHPGSAEPPLQGGETATPAPIWTPPPIPVDTLQVDETQTGELVIYIPPWSFLWSNPAIDLYRKIYPNVNLIVQDFSNAENIAYAYSVQISTELAAGKGPDIIFPSHMFGSDLIKMAQAGAFLDLNELIELDESFNFDGYVKPVLDGGIFRGRRYTVPFDYFVDVYVSNTKMLDEIGFDRSKTGDAISFMSEILRALPKAQTNPAFRSMFNDNLLFGLFRTIELVDYETNTILPNEEGLKKLLEAYKPYYPVDSAVGNNVNADQLLNGVNIFGTNNNIQIFVDLMRQLKTRGAFELSVMPDMDGKIHAWSIYTAAINSGSQNQQNAWNFIKLMLSPEYQSSEGLMMSVHKNTLITKVEKWRTDAGNISRDEAQIYLDMVMSADYCYTYNSQPIYDMFIEHMTPFLEDKVSWETAVNRLRNQLSLYVSE
jgi:ABC-type glycerol-3-phosphate transport system substrate-binding protein